MRWGRGCPLQITEAYLEPCQTSSVTEIFYEKSQRLAANYFNKKAPS